MATSVITEERHVMETVLDVSNRLSNEKLVCGGQVMGQLTEYFPSMHKGWGSICWVWFCTSATQLSEGEVGGIQFRLFSAIQQVRR